MKLLDGVKADATLSLDGVYRYALFRDWFPKNRGHVLWIMLNPSTADAEVDDPTIRRCQSFAQAWGYDGITVANLYGLRSKNPSDLLTHPDPVGPENDYVLRTLVTAVGTSMIVAAWGVHATPVRVAEFGVMAFDSGRTIHTLGFTKAGSPRHPLYVKGDTEPVVWLDGDEDLAGRAVGISHTAVKFIAHGRPPR